MHEFRQLAQVSHLPLRSLKLTLRCKQPAPDVSGVQPRPFTEHCVSTPWLLMLLGYMGTNHQCGTDRMFKAMHMLESLVMPAVAKLDNKQKKEKKNKKKERNNRK